MSVVFVLGAGASHGDSLELLDSGAQSVAPHPLSVARPPLTKGFCSKSLYTALNYEPTLAESDYRPVFDYARNTLGIFDPVGEGRWRELDLEDLFTSIEVHRELSSPESDESALLLLIRNKLTRYLQRILGFCTADRFGAYSRLLVSSITMEDSVITFNYDLLLDQEFYRSQPSGAGSKDHYENFEQIVLRGETTGLAGPSGREGVYLKLHGSLNWSRCTNPRCPRGSILEVDSEVQAILNLRMGIGERRCTACDGELVPLLIPPLLHKPITEQPAIRAAWGLAKKRLTQASTVLVIGYSAPPTDFYSRWLLRSSVGTRNNVRVVLVNPDNGSPEFERQMKAVFPVGYERVERTFTQFCQLEQVLNSVGLSP